MLEGQSTYIRNNGVVYAVVSCMNEAKRDNEILDLVCICLHPATSSWPHHLSHLDESWLQEDERNSSFCLPSLYLCNPQPHRHSLLLRDTLTMHFGTPRWLTATCDVITMPTATGLKASVTMLYCTERNVRNAINDPNPRRGHLHPITVPPHSSFPIPFLSPINTLLPCTVSLWCTSWKTCI